MRMLRGLAALAALGWLAVGCEGGCRGNSSTPFDPAVGYQPLEPCTAPFPAATATDPHPETIETVAGPASDWDWAHGAGYVHAPLEAVWTALHDPAVSRIHGPDWHVTGAVEPDYPLTFAIYYEDGPLIARVHWTIAYRGGPLDTATPPAEYGLRYQKIDGTNWIPIQAGSMVATDAGDGVTAVQIVCHLKAQGQGPEDARGTVTDWYSDLLGKVHAP